jgi:hypothetical protein
MLQGSAVQGYISSASFAKYDRSKPHLNVGTIGKSQFFCAGCLKVIAFTLCVFL